MRLVRGSELLRTADRWVDDGRGLNPLEYAKWAKIAKGTFKFADRLSEHLFTQQAFVLTRIAPFDYRTPRDLAEIPDFPPFATA
jgi:hypothetical protein